MKLSAGWIHAFAQDAFSRHRGALAATLVITTASLTGSVWAAKPPLVAPDSVTITETRSSGPFAGLVGEDTNARRTVWLRKAGIGGDAETLAANDSGEHVRVKLRDGPSPVSGVPTGVRTGSLTLDELPGAGNYKGTMPLGDTDSFAVSVRVQDLLLWPLLAVLLGALAGGFGAQRYALRRRRDLLKAKLVDALERYETARAQPLPGDHKQYELALPARNDLPAKKRDCTDVVDSAAQAAPLENVAKIWCSALRLDSPDAVDELLSPVTTISDAVDEWLRVDYSLRKLLDVLDAITYSAKPQAIVDTERLLADVTVAPVDAMSANALVAELDEQTNVLAAFQGVWLLWQQLNGQQQQTHKTYNPDTLYAASGAYDARTPAETRKLLVTLDQARTELGALPVGHGRSAREGGRALDASVLPRVIDAASQAAASLVKRRPTPATGAPSSATLLGRVRNFDWTLAILTFVVTALAYVLTVYPGKDFGSLTQYLAAICAGFLGQVGAVAFNWNLFPPFRSTDPAANTAK